jgi:hypothetical protein
MNWTTVRKAIRMVMSASPSEVPHPPSWLGGRINTLIELILEEKWLHHGPTELPD